MANPEPSEPSRAAPATAQSPALSTAPTRPRSLGALAGQVVLYGLFGLAIGVFSRWPVYRHMPPDQALVKLSLVHTGRPVADCTTRSAEELAKLPPNMRIATRCPRERSPVTVELDVDGQPAARLVAHPSGLSNDGASAIYKRLQVAAGERRIAVRMRDDQRREGFAYTLEQTVTLAPQQVVVIDFDPEARRLILQ